MKKVILSLLLFILIPVIGNAEVDYDITDYYIDAYILENGDLHVKELFVLDGYFNGYERDIIYTNDSLELNDDINFSNNAIYNADGIYDLTINGNYVNEVNFDTLNKSAFNNFVLDNFASNGDIAKYIKSNLYGGERYRMYYKSNGKRVAFFMDYKIDNAVVIHNDVAELYWNFIGSDYADDINNLNIQVHLPKPDASNNFRIWAHGDVTGEIDFLEENLNKIGAYATMDKVDAYDPVDIRMTFDKNLIKDTSELEHSGISALDQIIEVETERANVANELRNILKAKYYGIVAATIIYYVAMIIVFIYVVKKYGIDKKSDFKHEYNREFIDDYNVEVVDYLINKKNITPNAMSASIMNLIYKKNIKAEEIVNAKNKKKDYKFTLLNEENINDTEKILINFLFKRVGSTDQNGTMTFTTIQLKKYASASSTCESFVNTYTSWKHMVVNDGEKQGFYENTKRAITFGIILLVIALIIFGLSINWGTDFILTYFLPIIGIAFLVYTIANTQKSSKGALHYAKWMAFKRFLEDFGNFPEKELPEIILWERYLVYAVVFGIADKVEKAMNVKIREYNISNPTFTNVYVYNYDINYAVNRAIHDSINSGYQAQAAKRAAAASRSSSGGGFGGGFSSGGGFGGGGGGGRGF